MSKQRAPSLRVGCAARRGLALVTIGAIAVAACGGGGTAMDSGVGDGSQADTGVSTTSDVLPMPTDGSNPPGGSPMIAGCRILPAAHPLNADVSRAPLHPRSAAYIAAMNPTRALHADWGDWSTDHYGIPWQTGTGSPPVALRWSTSWGPRESERRPCAGSEFCYPIPTTARIEGGPAAASGADRHVLYIDTAGAPDNCTLYELYNAQNFTAAPWVAANGAIFPLGTTMLRPDQWTSADAAGLPILPTLVRVEEVMAGEINHAIRFTMARTAREFIHPATHAAGTTGADLPPMGLRLRLRASFDESRMPASAQVIVRAMKRFGLILADNGSDWFITGDSDDRWRPLIDDINTALRNVRGMDFEVVDTGPTIPQG